MTSDQSNAIYRRARADRRLYTRATGARLIERAFAEQADDRHTADALAVANAEPVRGEGRQP